MGLAAAAAAARWRRGMSTAGLPWSVEQQRLLAAMGYVLYQPRYWPRASARGGANRSWQAPASGADIDFDDPLFPALIRAAGLLPARPSQFDWLGWAQAVELPPLATLRRDPQAKRALWPRLRRWRRMQARR
jgi:hypothetical protein